MNWRRSLVLGTIIASEIFIIFSIFARIGSAFMLLPTVGESFNNPRSRLAFAIVVSLVLFPVLSVQVPGLPDDIDGVLMILLGEILVGIFFGAIMRAVFMALSVTGTVIALMTGFSNALIFNPALTDQGILQAVFLTLFGIFVVFITNTHHFLLLGLVETYSLFPPGDMPNMGDIADSFATYFSKSFNIGVQMSTPFIISSLIFFISIGLLSRLMPQLQIFFVAMPLQILIGLTIFMVTLGTIMGLFVDVLRNSILTFPNFY